ncbi:hypothetical protein EWM64_g938 [Hericium alpestre]|uniref:ABC1 atypical kinase-like domain-containing protein n=1 Tax=Hericium alpestre TaxID=135208 RepID=A0A4Z0A7L5_9AGAM|nr:hypothetical protein EWM64_g938 [Hericium alpestre]
MRPSTEPHNFRARSKSADVETTTPSTSDRVEVPYIAASTEQLFSPQNTTHTADNVPPSPFLTDAQETLSTSANYPIHSSAAPQADPLIADPVGSVKAEVPDDLSLSPIVPIPEEIPADTLLFEPQPSRHLQSSKVPSSRLGRLFHYGGLAASLGVGAASEYLRRSTGTSNGAQSSSLMMSEANVTRLVSKLSKMRGAALKLGQFMSIQDTHVLPSEVEKVFRRVQDNAHYMPNWQMEQVLTSSLGPSWRDNFASFDAVPFAAASIGQSVESDLGYMKVLLTAGRLLPPGLFLNKTMAVMKEELADECDYAREAGFLRAFGAAERLGGDARYKVPWVWDGSTGEVLVMERVDGIAARIIELCLRELFVFRQMQTDPNWTNFLWNARTRQIELVDFGATRAYSAAFIDNWLRLLQAAAASDREACREWSLKLGYLTGEENDVMVDAHVTSMALLATPFRADTPQPFAFGKGSRWAGITAEIRAQIPTMLQYRLTPPPRETYSLNRKLSGAFLLAARLDARVDCKALWDKVTANYQFSS